MSNNSCSRSVTSWLQGYSYATINDWLWCLVCWLGRGRRESGKENPYSCAVLAGARNMHERRMALEVITVDIALPACFFCMSYHFFISVVFHALSFQVAGARVQHVFSHTNRCFWRMWCNGIGPCLLNHRSSVSMHPLIVLDFDIAMRFYDWRARRSDSCH